MSEAEKHIENNPQSELEKLKKTSRYLNVINRFATGFLETNTVDEIVWMVAREAIGELGFEDCVVYLFEPGTDQLIQRAAYGPKNPIDFDIHNPIILQKGQGIVGYVAESGVGEIVNDTINDKRYHVDDEARFSEITVPIMAEGKVIGVIDSEHSRKDFFTEQDLKTLTTIASMTSSRLAQAYAIEKLNKHQQTLEESVANKTKELHETLEQLVISNDELSLRNQEKEVLLKEVHHRVKNNLQIIVSLLNLQMYEAQSEHEIEVFKDCQLRIRNMAMIHDNLYSEQNISNINLRTYTKDLAYELIMSYGLQHRIETKLEINDIFLDIEEIMPVCLILNELIANAFKHAFPDNREGWIRIGFSNDHNNATLVVEDNGVGIDVFEDKPKSVGLELIKSLTEQIDGKLMLDTTDEGTKHTLTFEISRFSA